MDTTPVPESSAEPINCSAFAINGEGPMPRQCQQGPPQNLVLGNQINITVALVVMMFAMGCTLTLKDLKYIFIRPVGLFIGFVCQFGLMPLIGFALAHAFDLSPGLAIGTILIACCPGGINSNILTYWTEGDIALSVSMTAFSTLFAVAMMPWCLFLYTRSWHSLADAVIPYVEIIIALVTIVFPCIFGMLVRWKFKKAAKIVGLVCSFATLIAMVVFFVLTLLAFPLIYESGWRAYAVSVIYPLCALFVGYLLPWLLRRPHKQCRTIAFETGVQNGILAMTILNFQALQGFSSAIEMMTVPVLYSLVVFAESFLFVIAYWIYKAVTKTQDDEAPRELQEKDIWAGKLAYINPMLSPRGKYLDRSVQTGINLWGNKDDKIIIARQNRDY
ncbi:ileal sodium/bile acid cotransporter-like [Saccoglossus kowalevskii]|uniref:Ileal sodium/bile acid cotransporter-like n=1 Tax=Saccoglossus kowalevskii TaxID=10224 RepID=A0ABM0GQM6_SACKO|nr:PREDICTED: ileal sodium/bile acid cotransporter-like [Saccoglossus kowalevskii]